jgi:hypothetical protein
MTDQALPLEHLVEAPLGRVVVLLGRWGLELDARGGFEARWAVAADEARLVVTPLEDYRVVTKEHLREVYRLQVGCEPAGIVLNLASHQLVDDLVGWTKLNYGLLGNAPG